MEKDTELVLIGKVTTQDEYDETKLFILPLDKRTLKSLRLARFLAWLIRLLMFIENIPLWPKKKKPPYPPPFSFESIQFSFWGGWITGENLPEDLGDENTESADALLGGKSHAIFTRAELETRCPSLLFDNEPDIRGTSVSVSPDGDIYFSAFWKHGLDEVSASAHISDILARKATASLASDELVCPE